MKKITIKKLPVVLTVTIIFVVVGEICCSDRIKENNAPLIGPRATKTKKIRIQSGIKEKVFNIDNYYDYDLLYYSFKNIGHRTTISLFEINTKSWIDSKSILNEAMGGVEGKCAGGILDIGDVTPKGGGLTPLREYYLKINTSVKDIDVCTQFQLSPMSLSAIQSGSSVIKVLSELPEGIEMKVGYH
jgi:hypothetical protein